MKFSDMYQAVLSTACLFGFVIMYATDNAPTDVKNWLYPAGLVFLSAVTAHAYLELRKGVKK